MLSGVFSYFGDKLGALFLSTGSLFSLTSLVSALCLAVLFLIFKRYQQNRRIRFKVIVRALVSRRITSSPSFFADVGFFFFNVFVYGLIFGWAVVSFHFLSNVVINLLVGTFGTVAPTALPEFLSRSIATVIVFLAYEFGYWTDHYLSHRLPILWEFHKIHHTAKVLTPLTAWRVHPFDTLKFYNILAVIMATANGFANYIFGATVYQYTISDNNLILVVFIHAYIHLQHTHLWIAFRGLLGCIFLSPAHHQVHHSSNPIHFDKNFGSCLAVWDWLFGTLHMPKKEREKLEYGVDAENKDVHTIAEGLFAPIYRAFSHVRPTVPKVIAPPAPTAIRARDGDPLRSTL